MYKNVGDAKSAKTANKHDAGEARPPTDLNSTSGRKIPNLRLKRRAVNAKAEKAVFLKLFAYSFGATNASKRHK